MKKTVNESDFMDAFRRYDRYDQFGYAALSALFGYLNEIEEETGEEMELDVIALCCDYSVADVVTIAQDYNIDISGMDADATREVVMEYLNGNTIVVADDVDGQILFCSAF